MVAQTIAAIPEAERNTRWLRLVRREHYRLRERDVVRVRGDRRPPRGGDALDEVAAPSTGCLDISADAREFAERIAQSGHRLANGRLSLDASARALGWPRRVLAAAEAPLRPRAC